MALLEQRDATLHDVLRILSDQDFRKGVAKDLRNETVRTFLLKEFDRTFTSSSRTYAMRP
jgi:hypothetical protein